MLGLTVGVILDEDLRASCHTTGLLNCLLYVLHEITSDHVGVFCSRPINSIFFKETSPLY